MKKYLLGISFVLSACASTSNVGYSTQGLIPSSDCFGMTDSGVLISIFTKQDLTRLEAGEKAKISGSIQIGSRAYQHLPLQINKLIFAKTDSKAPSVEASDVIHSVLSIKADIQYAGDTQSAQLACENHYRLEKAKP